MGRTALLFAGGLASSAGVAVVARGGTSAAVAPTATPKPRPAVQVFDNMTIMGYDGMLADHVGDVLQCQAICMAQPWCKAFVIAKPPQDPACYLKNSSAYIEPNGAFTTGIMVDR